MDVFTNKLKKSSIESFLWRILGVACLFSMHAMLGRELSPENYGLFSFTLSIVTVLVLFATMGWPSALVRLVPQYIIKQQWGLLKGALLRSHQLSIGLSVIFSIVLVYLSTGFGNDKRSDGLYYAALLLPMMSLITLRRRVFQGMHSVKGSIIPDEVLLPSLILVGLFILGELSIDSVILLYLLASCAVFILTLVWLWNILPLELRNTNSVFESKAWMALTFPLLFGGLSQMILSQSGVFILGLFDDLHGAGLFSASFRLALFVTFAMTAINVIGMPMLASAFHNKDAASLRLIFKKTMLWSFIGSLPPFMVLILFPEVILSLFGNGFSQAAILLQILAFGQLTNAAVGLSGSLLVVAGEEKFFATSMVTITLCCIVSMLSFVPLWGAISAAIIYTTSIVLLSLLQLLKTQKLIRNR